MFLFKTLARCYQIASQGWLHWVVMKQHLLSFIAMKLLLSSRGNKIQRVEENKRSGIKIETWQRSCNSMAVPEAESHAEQVPERRGQYYHSYNCLVQIPTLAVFALDNLTTYMTYFLYLAHMFKWGWRPQVCVKLFITWWDTLIVL